MHIEPGVVTGAKIALGYVSAAGAGLYTLKYGWAALTQGGLGALLGRSILTTALVFSFFEILPHYAVGVSEVHLIFGATLLLIFGVVPAALGLALGLLVQGVLFAPSDLPQYAMNVTTLLLPLFAARAVAQKVIAPNVAYVDLTYHQALALSATYQGGVILWVGFWAFYGAGFSAVNIAAVSGFAGAYALVIVLEPLVELSALALAKTLKGKVSTSLFSSRLYNVA